MSNKDHKLAAIVFTDIVGYTKRMEENEQLTMQLLQKQREIVFPIVESYGGEIIKEIGDGLLMMFESAIEAVRCAISIQTRLKDEELTIRAGIHIGDVIFKGGDVFGSAVNTAARIEPLAPANGICISETVRKQLENKDDIITISIGKKDLKGVGVPVEIFEVFIEGVSVKQKQTPVFILKDLWRRHVIQILFSYLIAAWIIKQAVAAITTKYFLSPHLVDLTWVILLSLIPTVFLLAYFHGKRSSGKWTKIEMIGFPINAILAVLLLVVLFNGKDLGATTNKVIVENEDGKMIEKTILKNEFRKRVLLFFYEDEQKNKTDQWLSYGIPALLEYDLLQDIFIRSRTAFHYVERFRQDGFDTELEAPLLYKKKVSSAYNYNYFATGSYSITNGVYSIKTLVYESKSGKLINEFIKEGENLFTLVDDISITIKKQIGFSDQQLEQMKDLPIADIYTNSMPALENYINGLISIDIDNDYNLGIDHMEKAILEDEEFAIAYLDIAQRYFNNNQLDKVNEILPKILQHEYKLSEREQYIAKFFYYVIKQKPDEALAVVKMWTELYPDDIDAHMTLANRLQLKSNVHGAIKEYEIILTLDPERYNIIRRIGYLYEALGNYDSALIYHQYYADKFPDDYLSYRNLANLNLLQNNFQKAKENFDKALLVEPEKVSLLLNRANVDLRLGDFDVAYSKYNEALAVCRTAGERGNVYSAFDNYYTLLGQIQNAFSFYQKEVAENKISQSPLDYVVNQTFNIYKYVQAGRLEEGMKLLKEFEPQFEPPVDKVIAFGYIFYYINVEDVEKVLPYIETAKELIYGFGQEALLVTVYFAEGRIAELKGEYNEAILNYTKFYDQQLTDNAIMRRLGSCYRKDNQMKLAKEFLDKAIVSSPFDALNHLEMASYFLDNNDKVKAEEHLLIALDIWKDADPDYKYANEARTKLQEISGT